MVRSRSSSRSGGHAMPLAHEEAAKGLSHGRVLTWPRQERVPRGLPRPGTRLLKKFACVVVVLLRPRERACPPLQRVSHPRVGKEGEGRACTLCRKSHAVHRGLEAPARSEVEEVSDDDDGLAWLGPRLEPLASARAAHLKPRRVLEDHRDGVPVRVRGRARTHLDSLLAIARGLLAAIGGEVVKEAHHRCRRAVAQGGAHSTGHGVHLGLCRRFVLGVRRGAAERARDAASDVRGEGLSALEQAEARITELGITLGPGVAVLQQGPCLWFLVLGGGLHGRALSRIGKALLHLDKL
mmetsp:Transcript_7999/g.21978  ORF Transcript_7999/g.21978 Transcript_7999/m.21978 type:complete len:296 (+) Transcript_7999:347-1234(+)